MKTRFPYPIPDHGTIGVTAPSSPVDPQKLDRGVRYLNQLGYRVKVGKSCHQKQYYVAGTDKSRARELMHFFERSDIDAIFCARGGYGAMRLLPLLDFAKIRKSAKLLVGFSDITALQWAIWEKSRLLTLSAGMVATDMGKDPVNADFESAFWNMIGGETHELKLDHSVKLPKEIHGTLLPGTLSVGLRLLGTSYLPSSQNLIPVLEDVNEPAHKFEGHLLQLKYSSFFQRSNSVLFGHISPPDHEEYTDPPSFQQIISHVFKDSEMPVFTGLRYGHIPPKIPLPVGAPISLYLGIQSTLSIEDIFNRS